MDRLALTLFVWLLAAVSMPAAAWAQQAGASDPAASALSRRGYRGLFAPPADPDQEHNLVLAASLYGAYDDNVFAGNRRTTSSGTPDSAPRGYYSGAESTLRYVFSGDRVSFASGGGAQVRYYPQLEREIVPLYHESTELSTKLGSGTRLFMDQRVAYTPFYRFNLFSSFMELDDPEAGIESNGDLDLFRHTAIRHSGSIGVSQEFGRRSSLQAVYRLRYVDFVDSATNDYRNQSASITYSRRLTSHATMNLGYGYRMGDVLGSDVPRSDAHLINAGIDYSRALSISRRTVFGFGTGSAVTTSDRLSVPGSESRTRFRLIGNAHLTHEIGRTWTAILEYRRGLAFREGFNDPFVTDSAGADIGGLVSRRLELSAGARYVHATLAATGQGVHDAFAASAQATYGLSRHLALYARYFYYEYDFDRDVPLDLRFTQAAGRQGVRVGVTASVPLLR